MSPGICSCWQFLQAPFAALEMGRATDVPLAGAKQEGVQVGRSRLELLKKPILEGIIYCLPSNARALFGCTAKAFHAQGSIAELAFVWTCGHDVATGDDGWCTEFGITSAVTSCTSHLWWALELLTLDGLLVLGVADRSMKDNVFCGSPSRGLWKSWGWELTKHGHLLSVDSCAQESQLNTLAPLGMDLKPRAGRRIVLILHLDMKCATLQLYARITEPFAPASRTSFLDSMMLTGSHVPVEAATLRPVASMNIGAAVQVVRLKRIG